LNDGRNSGNELAKGHTKELDEYDHEQLETEAVRSCSAFTEAHGEDHEDPVKQCAYQAVREFPEKLGKGEDVRGLGR
jgi:hypothetical protein